MRKQVGFNVIVENIGAPGQGGVPKEVLLQRIQVECPFEDGWEVLTAVPAQVAASTIAFAVFLVQYKDFDAEIEKIQSLAPKSE